MIAQTNGKGLYNIQQKEDLNHLNDYNWRKQLIQNATKDNDRNLKDLLKTTIQYNPVNKVVIFDHKKYQDQNKHTQFQLKTKIPNLLDKKPNNFFFSPTPYQKYQNQEKGIEDQEQHFPKKQNYIDLQCQQTQTSFLNKVNNDKQKDKEIFDNEYLKNTQKPLKISSQKQNRISSTLSKFKSYKEDILDPSLFDADQSIKNFVIESSIGKGYLAYYSSYATVFKGYEKSTKNVYAIKVYELSKLNAPYKLQNLKREIKVLRYLNHPSIIKLHYAIKDYRQVSLIMEYPESVNLKSFLSKQPHRNLPEKKAQKIIAQVLSAINYCHENGIVHRDIKPDNILIDKDFNAKLIDFGFSIRQGENKKLNMFCGTPSFMSPQIVQKQSYLGQKADVWAIGVMFFYILYGRYPFRGNTDTELYKNIAKGNLIQPETYSNLMKDIFNKFFKIDESKRFTATEMMQIDYFRQN